MAPVNIVLVFIFRYAKPSPPKTPLKQYQDQMKQHKKIVKKEEKCYKKELKREAKRQKHDDAGKASQETVQNEEPGQNEETVNNENTEEPIPPKQEGFQPKHQAPEPPQVVKIDTRAKKKFQLPHWFIYIGYFLAFATVRFVRRRITD